MSSLPLASSPGTPLVAANNPLSMCMGTSRFAGVISNPSAPASKAAAKPSWNRELNFSGTKTSPSEKKGGVGKYKKGTRRAQGMIDYPSHYLKDAGLTQLEQ